VAGLFLRQFCLELSAGVCFHMFDGGTLFGASSVEISCSRFIRSNLELCRVEEGLVGVVEVGLVAIGTGGAIY